MWLANQTLSHGFASPWALADDEAEQITVIDLTEAELRREGDEDVHCPACQSQEIQVAVTRDGSRYNWCQDCGRLWETVGERLLLIVHARVRVGPRR